MVLNPAPADRTSAHLAFAFLIHSTSYPPPSTKNKQTNQKNRLFRSQTVNVSINSESGFNHRGRLGVKKQLYICLSRSKPVVVGPNT